MRSQVESYLQKQMVEEALILAETIAAVEQGKNNPDAMAKAEEVRLGKRAILVLLLFVLHFRQYFANVSAMSYKKHL